MVFTREVQVETSLSDDGTVREVEITFTVSQCVTLSIERISTSLSPCSLLECVSSREPVTCWRSQEAIGRGPPDKTQWSSETPSSQSR